VEGEGAVDEKSGSMLMERWVEDPSFRERMRGDAVGAAGSIGVELSAEDIEFLHSVDWTLSDAELEALLEERIMC
jgi:hypothetical protein